METMELICLLLVNTFSLVVGFVLGQNVVRQEKVELNPVKAVKKAITEHKETKEKQAEDEYMKALMYNIDHYDGSGAKQKDLPRR